MLNEREAHNEVTGSRTRKAGEQGLCGITRQTAVTSGSMEGLMFPSGKVYVRKSLRTLVLTYR